MLYPLNRYITVKPIEENQEEEPSAVLLPQTYYEGAPSPYMMVEVVEPHEDSKLRPGMRLVAPRSSVETVEFNDNTYHLLLENHAMGFFSENE
jgi:hypothetical protein